MRVREPRGDLDLAKKLVPLKGSGDLQAQQLEGYVATMIQIRRQKADRESSDK